MATYRAIYAHPEQSLYRVVYTEAARRLDALIQARATLRAILTPEQEPHTWELVSLQEVTR